MDLLGKRLWLLGCAAAVAATIAGCVVEHHDTVVPADTEIEFGEVKNLGYFCRDRLLDSWTVSNRETQTSGTAGCEQPVLFTDLAPNQSYTFDIQGVSGGRVCWQGTCQIFAAGGVHTFADCSGDIQRLCGF